MREHGSWTEEQSARGEGGVSSETQLLSWYQPNKVEYNLYLVPGTWMVLSGYMCLLPAVATYCTYTTLDYDCIQAFWNFRVLRKEFYHNLKMAGTLRALPVSVHPLFVFRAAILFTALPCRQKGCIFSLLVDFNFFERPVDRTHSSRYIRFTPFFILSPNCHRCRAKIVRKKRFHLWRMSCLFPSLSRPVETR